MTDTRAQTRPVIEYPIELVPPDIARFRDGNIGVRFVHSFEGAQPGPHLLITALVHGNEPAGAVALERCCRKDFVRHAGVSRSPLPMSTPMRASMRPRHARAAGSKKT